MNTRARPPSQLVLTMRRLVRPSLQQARRLLELAVRLVLPSIPDHA